MLIIFDSDPESAALIRQILEDECDISHQSIQEIIDDPVKLITVINKDKLRLINTVFIEISMKTRYNGIDLAQKIVKINPDIHIVFTTEYGKFYIQQAFLDCYDVYPCAYLVKPINKYFLKRTIEKIRFMDKNRNVIWIKTQRTLISVNENNIIYISIDGHCTAFHLSNQVYRSYTTIEDVIPSLPKSFVRCHKSYIINSSHIVSYDPTSITLDENIVIPISRAYRPIIKEQLELITMFSKSGGSDSPSTPAQPLAKV